MSQTANVPPPRRGAGKGPAGRPARPAPERPWSGRLAVTVAQRRLWKLDQAGLAGAAHHVARSVRLTGPLDADALGRALGAAVGRHDVLRAAFPGLVGRPLVRIAPASPLPLPVEDLRAVPAVEREAEARRVAGAEARRPFDVGRGPLLRARLSRLGERDHVLHLTAHAIVADERSLDLILAEAASLYGGCGSEPGPGPAAQFVEAAGRREQRLRGDEADARLAFWARRLAGAPPALEVPADRARPPSPSWRNDRLDLPLSATLAEGLRGLARLEGVGLLPVVLAGFKALLLRYTGQDDLVVGSPCDARSGAEEAGMVGPLSDLLVLRTDLSGDPTFRELVARVAETVREAHDRRDVPFARLVEALVGRPDPGRGPLVQVTFALADGPASAAPAPAFAGLSAEPFRADREAAEFDLAVTVAADGDGPGLSASFLYDADLYDAETVGRLAGAFRTLLEGAVADPGRRLASLPLLTEAEREAVLAGWNVAPTEPPDARCVHDVFAGQAARTPGAVAVGFEGREVTYGELDRRADRLARRLRGLGAGPSSLVGVAVGRSPEMLVALLGVLKAGAAYVPLDPTLPRDRLSYMIDDARVPVLLTETALRGSLPSGAAEVVCVDAEGEGEPGRASGLPVVTAADLAYVIYTSGSTGRPKGVQVTHGCLSSFLGAMRGLLGLTAGDRLLAVTTLSFDIAGLELFLPLTLGARVELASRAVAADGARLAGRLGVGDVTALQATPATWRMLLEAGWPGSPGLTMLCGGEPLPRDLADRLVDKGAALWNLYGPTETTIWSSAERVAAGPGPVSIGYPIDGTRLYVLDPHLNPVPVGVTGELYIGGAGVARGYGGRPGLTAERFLPDPFGPDPGGRIYRTGDLARRRPDGRLDCLGRGDHQVKVRGFRIELGEIEAALLDQPGVASAVALAREDTPGHRRLVAYVVAEPGRAPAPADLRRGLRDRLPEYMVPSAFVALEAMPLSPNGKVDRRALPAPGPERPELGQGYVAPRDALEAELVAIWEETLNVRPTGVRDDFFELGLDSLTAAHLFALLQKRFGDDLPPGAVFRAPTVEQLADLIRRRGDGAAGAVAGAGPSLVPVRVEGSRPPLFCVHGGAGTVLIYHGLSRHLGPDQPLYALQARGLYGRERPVTRIEEMAAHYVEEVRAVRPRGPYHLVGFCSVGGVIALEMARQLRGLGEEVAFLAGLNAPTPAYDARRLKQAEESGGSEGRASRLREQARGLRGAAALAFLARKAGRGLAARARKHARDHGRTVRHYARKALYWSCVLRNRPLPDSLRELFFVEMHARAERLYPIAPYPGRLVLFQSKGLYPSDDLGWGGLVGGLEVHEIIGDQRHHRDLMDEPAVGRLAEAMAACLRETDPR